MIGAIAGDIIGSIYEFNPIKTTDFPLFSPGCKFTDDSVLTIALADSLMSGANYVDKMKEYFAAYPWAGFGGSFYQWASSTNRAPYNSWGNGAAMRISPVGFAFNSLEETISQAKKYTALTHNHPEGIKGACAAVSAIYMARTGSSKEQIRAEVEKTYGYDLHRSIEEIRPNYHFEVSCQKSVPEAIIAFLESSDYESAVRLVVSLGGDSDTQACISGGIAQAFYGEVPPEIKSSVYNILDERLGKVTERFSQIYNLN